MDWAIRCVRKSSQAARCKEMEELWIFPLPSPKSTLPESWSPFVSRLSVPHFVTAGFSFFLLYIALSFPLSATFSLCLCCPLSPSLTFSVKRSTGCLVWLDVKLVKEACEEDNSGKRTKAEGQGQQVKGGSEEPHAMKGIKDRMYRQHLFYMNWWGHWTPPAAANRTTALLITDRLEQQCSCLSHRATCGWESNLAVKLRVL